MPNLVRPGDTASENYYLQLAESRKYDSSLVCTIAELEPGIFAVYQFAKTLYVGPDWDEVLAAYHARPAYTNRPYIPTEQRSPTRRGSGSGGKISSAEKAANTARLLAALKGA